MRVAIYARASVSRGLEFDSVMAQTEAMKSYVASQQSLGWMAMPEPFVDDGYSGGNVDRPAFARLMGAVDRGEVNVIVVHRLDRLSRSLLDFAQVVDRLEKRGIALVSVTQQFSTATSLGKLTLGILMSFAQFEREQIAERTAEKVRASRLRGMWTGGPVPCGYLARDRQLVVDAESAERVRQAYRAYLDTGSLVAAVADLDRRAIRNRSAGGTPSPFNVNTLRSMLTNPVYRGLVRAGDQLVAGKHEAIVDQQLWDEVQRQLRGHRRPARRPSRWGALLTGILTCGRCGSPMTHSANRRGPRIYRYYSCHRMTRQGAAVCPGSRAPAGELEEVVLQQVRCVGKDPQVLVASLNASRQARATQEPELVAESRRLAHERGHLSGQRGNLLDALQHGGGGSNAIGARLAEVDEQMSRLQQRSDEVAGQLAAIVNDTVDESAIREALAQFTGVWDELVPKERARLLRLLIAEVRYDAGAGEVTVEFRDNGIRALAREGTRRTA